MVPHAYPLPSCLIHRKWGRLLLGGGGERRPERLQLLPGPRAGAGSNNDIVTTPATDSPGVEPSWSNYGSCVDIWASRKRVRSTRNGGTTTLISGTSMASPHVGGTGALYLSSKPLAAPATVESALKSDPVRTGEKSEDGRRIRLVYAGGY
jgi:subtilisin family serine protease